MKTIVTTKAMRPVSDKKECFYCHQPLGHGHKSDCVLIKKTVTVKAVITYDIEVPADWDKKMVEFSRNDSSWCASNMIAELEEFEKDRCLCSKVKFEYIEDKTGPFLKE